MGQYDPKITSLMTALTKNLQHPSKKIFLSADEKTGWSVWALEQLSSAIGRGAMELVRQLKTAGFRPQSRYEHIVRRLSKCQMDMYDITIVWMQKSVC